MRNPRQAHFAYPLIAVLLVLSLTGCGKAAPAPAETAGPAVVQPTQEANPASPTIQAASQPEEGPELIAKPQQPAATKTPGWQVQAEPVASQPLDPGKEVVVETGTGFKLTAPAGLAGEGSASLVVSKITNEVPPPLDGLKALALYEVTVGEIHSLQQPLTVEISYDPTILNPEFPAAEQLAGGLRDEASGRWMMVPLDVDETAHVARYQVDHLSLLGLFYFAKYSFGCPTEHFTLWYFPDEVFSATGNMKTDQPVTRCQGHNPYVRYAADYLEAAYTGYTEEGFTFPSGKISVIIAPLPNSNSDPQYDTLTGMIILGLDSWEDLSVLRQQCGHELFHYVQYQFLGASKYLTNQFWMDATADFAGDKPAWYESNYGRTEQMGKDIQANYLQISLESTNDLHHYSTAHFVDYLMSQAYAFPGLFELMVSAKNDPGVLPALDAALQANMGMTLGEAYADFAAYMLFDWASPLPIGEKVWGKATADTATMYAETKKLPAEGIVENYSSQLFGLKSETARFLNVEWLNENEGQVYLFQVSGDSERSGIPLHYRVYPHLTGTFPITPNDTVYVLMVNPTDQDDMNFQLEFTESSISTYTISLNYDNSDSECASRSGQGSAQYRMKIDEKSQKVAIEYNSAKYDSFWTPEAEHTVTAMGAGAVLNGSLEASFHSSDEFHLGTDEKGNLVIGNISIDVNFQATASTITPLYWDVMKIIGTTEVKLPPTSNFKGYSCSGTVRGVGIYPAFDFPRPAK